MPRSLEEWFGRRIAESRARLGLTQSDMPARLKAVGLEMQRPTVVRIERGQRQSIRLEEIYAFAKALGGVSPLSLLFPDDDDAEVELPDGSIQRVGDVRAWFTGSAPPPSADLQALDDWFMSQPVERIEEFIARGSRDATEFAYANLPALAAQGIDVDLVVRGWWRTTMNVELGDEGEVPDEFIDWDGDTQSPTLIHDPWSDPIVQRAREAARKRKDREDA